MIRELNVYQTASCNLRCRWCLRQVTGEYEWAPDVTVPVLERTLSLWPEISSACIAGFGEPLLSPTLDECVTYLRQRGVYVGVVSNGLVLDRARAERLAGLDVGHVSISVNAATPSEWRNTSGHSDPKGFAAVCSAVRHCVRAGLRTMTSFVVDRDTYDRIPRYLQLAIKLGAHAVTFANVLPAHGLRAGFSLPFWDSVILDGDAEALSALESYRSLDGAALVTAWPVPLDTVHGLRECRSPLVSVGVDGRGAVSCCRRVSPPSQNFASIWAPDPYAAPRWAVHRAAMDGDYNRLPDGCRMCFGRGVTA